MDRLAMLERLMHKEYKDRPLLVSPDELHHLTIKFAAIRLCDTSVYTQVSKKSLNLKLINIVDPTFSKNNLGKSISKLNSVRLKQAL